MAKDPAFLFYSKDWIEGTAEYMPEEKGVYIDLLCFQHQRGGLPTDTARLAKMVGISEEHFLTIWAVISDNFNRMDNRLVNRKLYQVMNERSTKSKVNTISGTFAGLLRIGKYNKEQYKYLKERFKIDDFTKIEKERLTERITEWITERLQERLKSIGNGNEDVNEDYIVLLNKVIEKNNIKMSPEFKEMVIQWLRYKSEKRQSYKEIGLKNFLVKVITDTGGRAAELESMIIYSTSKNYDGLFKEKQNGANKQNHSGQIKNVNDKWR